MTFDEIFASSRARWESQYGANAGTHILIGTATCGRAAGSIEVLEAFRRGTEGLGDKVRISEVGCMGLCSYEPLVTIIKPSDFSICYHHVTPQLVPQLIEGYVLADDPCLDLALGAVTGGGDEPASIPELGRFAFEQRLLLSNCGYTSPLDIDHYVAGGGYKGLALSLAMKPAEIVAALERSGLRGRGGAGSPRVPSGVPA